MFAHEKLMTEFIKTYCRIRPYQTVSDCSPHRVSSLEVGDLVNGKRTKRLDLGSNLRDGYYETSTGLTSAVQFQFDDIFDRNTDQREVYEVSSLPVVQSFLSGINGCVFCYGQTGSGKVI